MTRRPKTMRDVLQRSDTADLLWRLETTEPAMQARICFELGRRAAKEAVEPLRKHLSSRDQKVREASAEALGQIGDRSAGEDLLKLFSDTRQPETVRDTCAFALARLAYEPATQELVKALADPSPTVRICVVSALAAIRNPDTRLHVELALLIEQDSRVKAAIEAMLKLVPAQRYGLREYIDVSSHSSQSFTLSLSRETVSVHFKSAVPSIGQVPPPHHEHPMPLRPNVLGSVATPIDLSRILVPPTPGRQSQEWPDHGH